MANVIDIWNQALSECGARATVASESEASKEAEVCAIHYDNLRTSLLRNAPWACARFQTSLTLVESYLNDPPDNQYPWFYGYTYPSDCLKIRYLLDPPVDENNDIITIPAWRGPCRQNRFVPALDIAGTSRVILTNVPNAIGVYTKNITDVDLFDQGFWDALVSALCAKIVIPLTGNVEMKKTFEALAMSAITQARADDGNEAMPTTDHIPDWIRGRGIGSAFPTEWGFGFWYTPWDNTIRWGE